MDMTRVLDAMRPVAGGSSLVERRPDYGRRHPAPVLGWLVAVPCGLALWALLALVVVALLHLQ